MGAFRGPTLSSILCSSSNGTAQLQTHEGGYSHWCTRHAQITYLLILHPIAAVLAACATLMGIIAHLRGFGATCFTTCIASLAATVALLAFVFDIVVFLIAKNRIESAASGESAELGNVRFESAFLSLSPWPDR